MHTKICLNLMQNFITYITPVSKKKILLANNISNDMISHIMECELCIIFPDLKYSLKMSSRPYCYFIA